MSSTPLLVGTIDQIGRDAWERQKGESRQAFEAWGIYRDMEQGRTYARVARQLGKSNKLIERWGSAWRWQDRLSAWLRHLDRIAQRQKEQEIIEANRRHGQLGRFALSKVFETLNAMRPEERLPMNILASLLVASVNVERLALNMTTVGGKNSDSNGMVPSENEHVPENLVSEQIRKLAPVERGLLRELGVKCLRFLEVEADAATILTAKIDEMIDADEHTITIKPEATEGDGGTGGETVAGDS